MKEDKLTTAIMELAFQNDEKEKRGVELLGADKQLAFQNEEKEKRAAELIIANKELAFQNKEKEKRAAELIIANKELAFQNEEKEKRAAELIIANIELAFQKEEKEKRAAELIVANKELAFQNEEKKKRAVELIIANKEVVFQMEEKEKRTAELITSTIVHFTQRKKDDEYLGHLAAIVESTDDAIISKSLNGIIKSWNKGGEKMFGYSANEAIGRHISLIIPPQYNYEEKKIIERIRNNEIIEHYETMRTKKSGEQFYVSLTVSPLKDRAGSIIGVSKIARDISSWKKFEAELIHTNQELAFQNEEKEKRAAELFIANKELVFQHDEKEKRAIELCIANKELAFQNEEKEKRAAELIIANKELVFQHDEKEKRAIELCIANKELAFQNKEKEKRAAELIIANKELVFQHDEKEKRAIELCIANEELLFQNEEKEKRAEELIIAHKELESFTFISSHDLQEPLRKIQMFATRLIADESQNLSDKGKEYALRMQVASNRMRSLIIDLLEYSRTTISERTFETTDLSTIVEEVIKDFKEIIEEKNATIEVTEICDAHIIPFQFRQLIHNLISNALKFSNPDIPSHIIIKGRNIKYSKLNANKLLPEKDYCHITITDDGIGFEPQYKDKIFEIFKRVHDQDKISGTGIGLAIAKKIVENHNGIITATGELNKGASFDIYIPSS